MWLRALLGLLPVCVFLGALLWLDSFKLVRLRLVLGTIALGGAVALVAYFANGWLLDDTQLTLRDYSRYVAPLLEEALKGSVIVLLIARHRIGFLIDAAILGFATGTGFATIENLHFLGMLSDSPLIVWVVRGLGTAVMHGGVSAIFAILLQSQIERGGRLHVVAGLVALLGAALLHAGFNRFPGTPITSTVAVLVFLPPLLWLTFSRSQRSVLEWLAIDWDADAEMLQLIESGGLGSSKAGAYLDTVKHHFDGTVLVDLMCYLRVHLELQLRAKGAMLARDNGLEVELDDETRSMLDELRFLERSIGRMGRMALRPILQMSRRDIWQIYTLGR